MELVISDYTSVINSDLRHFSLKVSMYDLGVSERDRLIRQNVIPLRTQRNESVLIKWRWQFPLKILYHLQHYMTSQRIIPWLQQHSRLRKVGYKVGWCFRINNLSCRVLFYNTSFFGMERHFETADERMRTQQLIQFPAMYIFCRQKGRRDFPFCPTGIFQFSQRHIHPLPLPHSRIDLLCAQLAVA